MRARCRRKRPARDSLSCSERPGFRAFELLICEITDLAFAVEGAIHMKANKVANTYRVESGKHFRLKDYDPAETGHWRSKENAAEALQQGIARTAELQDKLYAQNSWALLLIFQAMDAAGKDGIIKHVMSGINPEGCQVYSFKQPSELELQHDFLWRTTHALPERGHIGIFNRSYYEEVLVVRVHPEILQSQRTPAVAGGKKYLGRALRRHPQF